MVRLIPIGKRLGLPLAALTLFASCIYSQTSASAGQCAVTSNPTEDRAEGVTERLGDITFQCTGFAPAAMVSGNLSLFYPVTLTNRVDNNNNAIDAVLMLDSGSGFTPTGFAGKIAAQNITFQGLAVTVPATGKFNLKVSNVRGSVSQFGLSGPSSISASISAPFSINQSQVVVAYSQTGLYATLYNTGIACVGSPIPSTITLANLFAAQTAFASTRITEGFGNAFQPRGPNDDTGTRFIVRYSGFPANATVYVPTFVAGSDAAIPTAGGDLGGTQSGGQYTTSGTLLLGLVQFTDSTGAGGFVSSLPGGGGVFNTVTAVPLTNGAGMAVYEVMDANPNAVESAQFPTFIAIPSVTAPATAQETVSFAPVSSVPAASTTAPVPRFVATSPSSDCSIVGDCQAGYFPKLTASTSGLNLTAFSGGLSNGNVYIAVDNTAGGIMNWSASVGYNQGTGWLLLSPVSGQNNGTIMLGANAQGLAAGTYTANVTVSAGPAGSASFTVTLTVTAPTIGGTGGSGTGSTGTGTGTGTRHNHSHGDREFGGECGQSQFGTAGCRIAQHRARRESGGQECRCHFRRRSRDTALHRRFADQFAGSDGGGGAKLQHHGGDRGWRQQRAANPARFGRLARHLFRRRAQPGWQREWSRGRPPRRETFCRSSLRAFPTTRKSPLLSAIRRI